MNPEAFHCFWNKFYDLLVNENEIRRTNPGYDRMMFIKNTIHLVLFGGDKLSLQIIIQECFECCMFYQHAVAEGRNSR
jgi:hypothetical protein